MFVEIIYMKKYLLISISVFTFYNSFSQEKKLLQNYKFRVNNFKALDVNFGAQARSNRAENFGTNTNGNIGGNIGLRFNTIRSSDNFFQTSSTNLQTSAFSDKNTDNSNQRNSSQYNFKPDIEITNRWFNKNNFYYEIGGTIETDFNSIKRTTTGTANDFQNTSSEKIKANVLIRA